MLNRLFEFALQNRFLVVVFAGLTIALGIHSLGRLPIDAVPDVTPNQVQILASAPGLGPIEVEQFVTFPVETAMSGLPGIELMRSVSRPGLSAVTVFFDGHSQPGRGALRPDDPPGGGDPRWPG